jgi:DNA-binding response OmpR family regulator
MKILLAEDDRAAREALEALLRSWGYDLVSVADGLAAWEALRDTDPPQLALLDWMMPGLEGVEVCRRAREHFTRRPPYLILITARAGEDDLIAGLEGGADEYIVKPVSPHELRARLKAGARVVELHSALSGRVNELEEALTRVRQLQGLLPICMYCKKVRDDHNYWRQVEEYISAHSLARFSHGVCPDCYDSVIKTELAKL